MNLLRRETPRAGRHQQAAAHALVSAGPHDRDIGERAIRDLHLVAVETSPGRPGAPRCASPPGRSPRRAPSAQGSRSPLRPPCAAATPASGSQNPPVDGVHGQGALHRYQTADPAVAGLKLQTRQAVRRRAGACAAIALQVHAEHAELAKPLRELVRDARLLEPLADVREDALLDERANRVTYVPLLVGQQAVYRQEVLRTGASGAGPTPDIPASLTARCKGPRLLETFRAARSMLPHGFGA